jgi:uracil-DNA glycosylase family 4
MPNWVNGEGPSIAELMVIGEAPGRSEDEQGIPFCGKSGQLVNEMLAAAGTPRNSVYVTNVVKLRPPDNNIRRLNELGKTLADFEPILWNEINAIKPNAILALGNLALKTITGKTGIVHYRGSILPSSQGYPKVIPSIHPANLLEHRGEGMFHWRDKVFIQLDFARAAEQSKFKEFRLPQRNLWICRDSLSLMKFVERNLQSHEVAVDIETFKSMPLCIGLSFNKSEGVSIPLLDLQSAENPKGIGIDEAAHMWKIVGDILYDEKIKKIGQNYKFDGRILRAFGLETRNFRADTMLKFHTLYPEFPKRLEFISSIYTEEPYYKSEGREFNPKKDNLSRLFLYNAKDAAVTKEVDEALNKELVEFGLTEYYESFMHKLHDFYYYVEEQGILHDKTRYVEVVDKYLAKRNEEKATLNRITGYEINPDSPDQICNLLYNELRLPKRTRRRKDGKSTLTADENALVSLLNNVIKDDKRRGIVRSILKCRGIGKTLGTYLGRPKNEKGKSKKVVHFADSDDRVRTSYLICGTESGRTSTNKIEPPVRAEVYGLAFQTITKHSEEGKDIRSIFISAPGKVLLEADQKQAEARIALLLAQEYEQLKLMDTLDIHVLTASWITGSTYEEQLAIYKAGSDTQRQIGKHSRHANDNGIGKGRLVDLIFNHSNGEIEISAWKAGKILEIIDRNVPNIKLVFHAGIQECLAENRTLVDPWGRKRTFYERWGDELFKEGYAHLKQSTVTGLTQRAGMQIHARAPWIQIIYEGHDALLFELPENRLEEAQAIIKPAFETPIDFSGCSLSRGMLPIPCEFQVGTRWSEMRKV